MVPGKEPRRGTSRRSLDGCPAATYLPTNSDDTIASVCWPTGAASERPQLPPPPDGMDGCFTCSCQALGSSLRLRASRRRSPPPSPSSSVANQPRAPPPPPLPPPPEPPDDLPAASMMVTVACVCAPKAAPPVGDTSSSVIVSACSGFPSRRIGTCTSLYLSLSCNVTTTSRHAMRSPGLAKSTPGVALPLNTRTVTVTVPT